MLTSPTISTVGLSITIPLAILSDFVFFGTRPTIMSGSGAVLVVCGFVVISAEQWLRETLATCCPSVLSPQGLGQDQGVGQKGVADGAAYESTQQPA